MVKSSSSVKCLCRGLECKPSAILRRSRAGGVISFLCAPQWEGLREDKVPLSELASVT